MELYLVRHGETEWNKERRLQGQADVTLDDFGKTTGSGNRRSASGHTI